MIFITGPNATSNTTEAIKAQTTMHPWLGTRRDGELIEMRHAVRLGPKRDLATAREGPIGHREKHLAIEGYSEPVIIGAQIERVPGV